MTEFLVLEGNPKKKHRRGRTRRTRKSRKHVMPAGLKRYWAKKRKRKNPRTATGHRVVKHRPVFFGSKTKLGIRSTRKRLNPLKGRSIMARRRKHHRRRYRHNPPMKNIIGNIGNQFKPALIGAAGIAINKFLSGQVAKLAKIDVTKKTIVELASALFLLPMIGRLTKQPMLNQAGQVAAAVAVFDFIKPQLPATVQAQLSGYEFPVELTRSGLNEYSPMGDIIDPGIAYIPEYQF